MVHSAEEPSELPRRSQSGEAMSLLPRQSTSQQHHQQQQQQGPPQGATARRAARQVRSSFLTHVLNFSFGSKAMLRLELAVRLAQVLLALMASAGGAARGERCEHASLIHTFCILFAAYSLYMVSFSLQRYAVYTSGTFAEQCDSDRKKSLLDVVFVSLTLCGLVFVKGGSTHEKCSESAPLLYTCASVLLVSALAGLLTPLIVCAGLCCCMPCFLAVLRRANEQIQDENRNGASEESLKLLPTHEFSSTSVEQSSGHDVRRSSDDDRAVGYFKGRKLTSDDAICCICITSYETGHLLCELPCKHHFHDECVKQWLRLSAHCPICKTALNHENDSADDNV